MTSEPKGAQSFEGRLSKLEAVLENVVGTMEGLAASQRQTDRRIGEALDKISSSRAPNWQAVSVGLAFCIVVGGAGISWVNKIDESVENKAVSLQREMQIRDEAQQREFHLRDDFTHREIQLINDAQDDKLKERQRRIALLERWMFEHNQDSGAVNAQQAARIHALEMKTFGTARFPYDSGGGPTSNINRD